MDTVKLAEREFAASRALTLPADALERWNNTTSGHRFMAFRNKVLKAFTIVNQRPHLIDTFECVGLYVHFDKGVQTSWVSSQGVLTHINHTPTELVKGCFVWHNLNTTLEYSLHKNRRAMHFAMQWRTQRHPASQEEGVTYLMEKAAFDALWGGPQ